ncbi:MAG: BON domain-containing protein [Halanaerobiales bacterium]
MGLFFNSKKYKDDELRLKAERAIKQHPILKKLTNISVVVEDGVVQILGKVKSESHKNRITKTVESKFNRSGQEYEKIENDLKIAE